MKIDKSKFNWYGFDHAVVAKQFEGELTYVGTFCVKGEYHPVAVYQAAKPNVGKGHKDFMLLQVQYDPITGKKMGMVRGMSKAEMAKEKYQGGIVCPKCQDVIYSVNRHDYRPCGCGAVHVDGGKDYVKCAWENGLEPPQTVRINLLTGEARVVSNDYRSKKRKQDAQA